MPERSISKSPEGEAAVMAVYNRLLARLPITLERRMIQTRFGLTQVTVTGPDEAPPLFALPGVHAPAPINLAFWLPLTNAYRLYSPDTLGQAGRSAQTRMSPRNHNYGKWVVDLLDGLGLDRVSMAGISFGGAVFLDTAAYAPERIVRSVLVVPAGIVQGNSLPLLFKLFLPDLLYRSFPSRNRLIRVFQPFMAEINKVFISRQRR